MAEGFNLADVEAAELFLQEFGGATKRRGYNSNLEEYQIEDDGASFACVVRDGRTHELRHVHVYYNSDEGWDGTCECGQAPYCSHVFAAMAGLLAEHRAEMVRNLSAGHLVPLPSMAGARRSTTDKGSELARRLSAAVGRAINREEAGYIRRVREVFTRCAQVRQMTTWDFQELDLPLGRTTGYLQIWPSLPVNDYDFWLYVALEAENRGVAIPEFMRAVTDLSEVRPRVARWHRDLEIERWQHTLASHGLTEAVVAEKESEVDFRLVIENVEAHVQWKRGDKAEFDFLKATQASRLVDDDHNGKLQLTLEAQLIWNAIGSQLYYGAALRLRYDVAEERKRLSRLLRMDLLGSRIVNTTGQSLQRPAEALTWTLLEPDAEHDDYRLRLVTAAGEPLTNLLCVFEGEPALYLTREALFHGPRSTRGVLEPSKENHVPAPVIESATGVGFLKSLRLEPPARIRDRIRMVPYRVAIHCNLQKIYPGSTTEECLFHVTAQTEGAPTLTWTGNSWIDYDPHRRSRKTKEETAFITLHDTSTLGQVRDLLEPLNLKYSGFGQRLTLRVSRKFPEVFAAWLKAVPPHIELQLEGELASLAGADVAGHVNLEVSEAEIDWFDLQVVLNVSDTTLSKEEVRLLLNAKGGFVRLSGKGWRRLKFDLTEEDDERLARLGLSPRELTAEPQRLHALQLADDSAKRFLPAEQADNIRRRAEEIKARVSPELPGGVTAELRSYQLEGYHFLAYLATNRFGGILADDMGLGKTLQALTWFLWLRSRPFEAKGATQGEAGAQPGAVTPAAPLKPSLVVCPKSVMDNWQAEAQRFTPGLRVRPWPALELARLPQELDSADLHVINYSQLRILGESLVPIRWLALILDEGQYIKNPNSQTAQVARALRAEHRLVLSGTPIENRLMDLWSLMAFVMPGVLGSRAQFAKIYDAKGDPFARRRLASRVRPFVLRRTKTQVAKDLPERIEEDLFCEIEGEQKTLYRAELKRAQQVLLRITTQKELAQQQFHFLTSMLRLRQICCHPALVKADSKAPSAKLEALLEQLEPLMEEGEKVLVFSQFVELLDLLRPAIEQRKWPVYYLVGSTEDRGALVKKFQSAEGSGVFLISLKAGGFGLNLTAANYVVVFDPWWNPAVENQAIDRTHRIGQMNRVIAYRLLIKDSIEEKIRALQKQKKALAEDVLGEAKFAQSLTLDDLRFLFSD